MDIKTKFNIGDTVWTAGARSVWKKCDTCHQDLYLDEDNKEVGYEPDVASFCVGRITILVTQLGPEIRYESDYRSRVYYESEALLLASEAEAVAAADEEVRLATERLNQTTEEMKNA